MGCLKLTYKRNNATLKVAYSLYRENQKKCAGDYRYGFNGKENDKETGTQDYGMRIYNPALGKFLSVDPLTKEYPWYSPYQFAGNKPIQFIDRDGEEEGAPMKPGGIFSSAIDNARAGYSNTYLINRDIIAPLKAKQEAQRKEIAQLIKNRGEIKPVNFLEKYFEGKSDFERTLVMDPSMQFAANAILAGGIGSAIAAPRTGLFLKQFSQESFAAGKIGGAFADATTQLVFNGGDMSKFNYASTITELNPFGFVAGAIFQGITSETFKTEGFKYQGLGSNFYDAKSLPNHVINAIFNIGGNLIGDAPGEMFGKKFGSGFEFYNSFIFNSAGNAISNGVQNEIEKPATLTLPKQPM